MKKKTMLPVCIGIAIIIAIILIVTVIVPSNKYKKASSMMESGDYAGAVEVFTSLGDYKDSPEQAAAAQRELDYQKATAMVEEGDYAGAVEAFSALGDFKDCPDQAAQAQKEVDYQAAGALMDAEDYAGAAEAFGALGDYKDSADQAAAAQQEVDYQTAAALLEAEDYASAAEAFRALGDYKDSADQAAAAQQEVDYQYASSLMEQKDYAGAVEAYAALGDYKDSPELTKTAQDKLELQIARQNFQDYNAAAELAEAGAFSDAYRIFDKLGDYRDSRKKSEQMRTARFDSGEEMLYSGDYQGAYDIFAEVAEWTYHKKYAEVDELEPAYYAAVSLFFMGKYEEAHEAFAALGDYADSADGAKACLDELAYRNAASLYEEGEFEEAKDIFDGLDTYKDSAAYSKKCGNELTYASLKEQLAGAEEMEEGSDDQKQLLTGLFSAFMDLGSFKDSREQAYQIAGKFFDLKDYDTCISMYETLDDYADSAKMLEESRREKGYIEAEAILREAENEDDNYHKGKPHADTVGTFTSLGDYFNSQEQVYELAGKYVEADDYTSALETFRLLGKYKDSEERAAETQKEVTYRDGIAKKEEGSYEEAIKEFVSLCYPEEGSKPEIRYKEFAIWVPKNEEEAAKGWRYPQAARLVPEGLAGGYKDSLWQIEEALNWTKEDDYRKLSELMDKGEYQKVLFGFKALGDLNAEEIEQCEKLLSYNTGLEQLETGNIAKAYDSFRKAGDVEDAASYVSRFYFLPTEIEYKNAYSWTYSFDYTDKHTMESGKLSYNKPNEWNDYFFDDEGRVIREIDHSTLNGGTEITYNYNYNDDGTISKVSDAMTCIYEEHGYPLSYTDRKGETRTIPGKKLDEMQNPVSDSITTYYGSENGLPDNVLSSVDVDGKNKHKKTNFYYKIVYTEEDLDLETIWKNVRLIAGENIW